MKAILLDEAKKWLEENCENQYTRMAVFGIIQSMPTVDYQKTPNEPMTIQQLREMDGEPVWIVDIGPHKWYGPGWAIVDRDNCLVRTAKNWNPVFFERYGERWLAYRRPPERQEDT